jgi:ABC-type nitrate/sulfonate/bicarbonate transport system substrate-binding protein
VTGNRSFWAAAPALVAAAFALAACGGSDDLVYPTETRPLTPAGYYAAEARGFSGERKLDVAFRPGNPVRAVGAGLAEFGIGSPSELVAARDRGNDLVNVAQVFQRGGRLEDGIFVEGGWISKPANRDTAVRFLEASFEGWAFCRDKPGQCLRIVRDRDPTAKRA